jgi:uncharacterized HAD superfamily protein
MPKKNKKSGLIIGVDMDDVIFDFNNSLHAYHNAKYGTSVKREDIISYDIEKLWHCTPEEASKKVFEFCGTKEHDKTSPIIGTVEALASLKRDHELHIITNRGEQIRDITVGWIENNFPEYFTSINLTNQYFGLADKKRTKLEICEELGVDVMIEDSMSHATEIAKSGRKVFLIDTPWNQGTLPENVTRVFSWSEIVKLLK